MTERRLWTNGNLQVLLEPTPAGQGIRLRTVKANSRTWLVGGLLTSGIAGTMAIAAAVVAAASGCHAPPRYVRAAADATGQLRIYSADGQAIAAKKSVDQVGVDDVAISGDGRAVGWLATFPNCCTTYAIPMELHVFSRGRAHGFSGRGFPIGAWCFEAAGTQVAFEQETVHGGLGVHYELRDIDTERLVAEYDPAIDSAGRSLGLVGAPPWVEELNARTTGARRYGRGAVDMGGAGRRREQGEAGHAGDGRDDRDFSRGKAELGASR